MIELGLLAICFLTYYLSYGYKFISLQRLPEPIFIVNIGFLLSFPIRAVAILCCAESLEMAPTFVLDLDTLTDALFYSFVCVIVFNGSYEYFLKKASRSGGAVSTDKKAISPVPNIIFFFYLLLGLVSLFFMMRSNTYTSWTMRVDTDDIPRSIHEIEFSLHVVILSSFLMLMLTKRVAYLTMFTIFFGAVMYMAFMLTARHQLIGYVLLLAIMARRCGYQIRPQYWLVAAIIAIPYIIFGYLTRYYGFDLISPDVSVLRRAEIVSDIFHEYSVGEVFTQYFALKVTNRIAQLETLMIYMQYAALGATGDLYDRLGSLPTALLAVPSAFGSVFGIDKGAIENMHVWFGSKYWYGEAWPSMSVAIPIGRITETYMVGRWLGVLLFMGYGYLFSLLYRVCYRSSDPMLIIYYMLIYYYYIWVDDLMFFSFSFLVRLSVIYFSILFVYRRTRPVTASGSCSVSHTTS